MPIHMYGYANKGICVSIRYIPLLSWDHLWRYACVYISVQPIETTYTELIIPTSPLLLINTNRLWWLISYMHNFKHLVMCCLVWLFLKYICRSKVPSIPTLFYSRGRHYLCTWGDASYSIQWSKGSTSLHTTPTSKGNQMPFPWFQSKRCFVDPRTHLQHMFFLFLNIFITGRANELSCTYDGAIFYRMCHDQRWGFGMFSTPEPYGGSRRII